MGKEAPAVPAPVEDKREILTRGFGENTRAYYNRLNALKNMPVEDRLIRPVRNSSQFREWPVFRNFYAYLAITFVVIRKMPFVNPFTRVFMWTLGICLVRSNAFFGYQFTEDDLNEISCFDLIKQKVFRITLNRSPPFKEEWEDWYKFNKPAYRTPVGFEYNIDSLARFVFVNQRKFKEKNVQWTGEWEQENPLVMDVNAPHNDHWFTFH